MRVEVVDQPERWIVGVATRTCNADEMDPQRSRLGRLWQRAAPDGEMVAVLTDYESDRHGEYTEGGGPADHRSERPAGNARRGESSTREVRPRGR